MNLPSTPEAYSAPISACLSSWNYFYLTPVPLSLRRAPLPRHHPRAACSFGRSHRLLASPARATLPLGKPAFNVPSHFNVHLPRGGSARGPVTGV